MHSPFVTFVTQRHPDGGSSWQKPETFFEIRELSRTVTLDRIVGVIDEELAGVINAAYDDLLSRRDRPHTFHDWSGVAGYSPAARRLLTGAVDASRLQVTCGAVAGFGRRPSRTRQAIASPVLGGVVPRPGSGPKPPFSAM